MLRFLTFVICLLSLQSFLESEAKIIHTSQYYNVSKSREIRSAIIPPTGKELDAVKELQTRVGSIMWNEHAKGASTMMRWLKLKKFDIDAAEQMIRAHVDWRKDMDMDKLRTTEPDPKLLKKMWYKMYGFARNGSPIMLMKFGEWEIRGYIKDGGTREEFDQHQGLMWEKALYAVEEAEIKLKKEFMQYIMICDLHNFAYRQLTAIQYIFSMVNNFENNYPEVIYYCYIINADWVFETLLKLIKPLMSGSIEKLKVHGRDRKAWEPEIRKEVDPVQIPYRYGGYSKEERMKKKLPPEPRI